MTTDQILASGLDYLNGKNQAKAALQNSKAAQAQAQASATAAQAESTAKTKTVMLIVGGVVALGLVLLFVFKRK